MFRGASVISLDAKGRLAMPARYRERLQDECAGQMITTVDTSDRCLLLYPLSEWEVIEEKLQRLSSFNPANRRVQRALLGYASETSLDSNGRMLLPTVLRDYAKLDKRIVLVGQGKRFELWDEAAWNAKCEEWLDEDLLAGDDIPAELSNLSI